MLESDGSNAVELHCRSEKAIDYLLESSQIDVSQFVFCSLHAPASFPFSQDEPSRKMLSKLQFLTEKYGLKNIVVHSDTVLDWKIFSSFPDLPLSIENSDERKQFGKSVSDIASVLHAFDLKLTLDLQHCFVNDRSMALALDFRREFADRIVEYHISGYDSRYLHYPLFRTRQDIIIESLSVATIPIIIESGFDEFGEHVAELAYIRERITS